MINPETGNRIKMVTTDAETGKELERRDLVKGYEFRKDQYLLLSEGDLDTIKVDTLGDDSREVRRDRSDRPSLTCQRDRQPAPPRFGVGAYQPQPSTHSKGAGSPTRSP
jgi:hypothetical protein